MKITAIEATTHRVPVQAPLLTERQQNRSDPPRAERDQDVVQEPRQL